jgi:magnesium transporter
MTSPWTERRVDTGTDRNPAGPSNRSSAETAGRILSHRVLTFRPGETVHHVLKRLATERPEMADLVIGVDQRGHYLGAVPLATLAGHPGETPVTDLSDRAWPAVGFDADQEHVAELARSQKLTGVPVVARDGRVVGAIPAARLLDVLWREHTEDMHRLAGIAKPLEEARSALDEPPLARVRHRLPWLAAGLAGSSLATLLMASFEETLTRNVKLAFFVPAIVYLADAIGTQTEAVAVRGLSLAHRPFWQLIAGETATGALIGTALAAFAFVAVGLAFQDVQLAATVAIAVMAAGTIATTVGLGLPWLLSRTGLDPAFGSGPLATIIQDVLSIMIYFMAVIVLMPA